MSKNKLAIKLSNRVRVVSVSFAIAGLIGGFGIAQADQYDNQITSLQQENNSSQSQVDSLANQASSYQGEINQLQAQVSSLQASLNINEAKQTSDQAQIVSDQNNITVQKQLLGDEVRSLYIDGQMSTIEELATSKSLSDYVD
jgi:peptidoglycan hydrolase CwlO-like protein